LRFLAIFDPWICSIPFPFKAMGTFHSLPEKSKERSETTSYRDANDFEGAEQQTLNRSRITRNHSHINQPVIYQMDRILPLSMH
jgi:hypothetical protein